MPGFEFDGRQVVSSDHALDWPQRPERVGIVGGGIVGCEFAALLAEVGSQVTVFEMMEQILPGFDPAAARELQKHLERRGVKFALGASAELERSPALALRGGGMREEVDVALVAVGRRPVTADLGLEWTGAVVDRGYVAADLQTMQTGQPGVYAVGDIVAETPGLAHGAFAEAIAAVTHIATGRTAPVDYRALPNVVYTHPEVAAVGLTEAQAVAAGMEVETTSHSLVGVGRAQMIGQNQGFVKVVNQAGGPIVGATVVGPQAGEMIHELMYAVGWEALPEEAAAFVHAHPTLSEAVGKRCWAPPDALCTEIAETRRERKDANHGFHAPAGGDGYGRDDSPLAEASGGRRRHRRNVGGDFHRQGGHRSSLAGDRRAPRDFGG